METIIRRFSNVTDYYNKAIAPCDLPEQSRKFNYPGRASFFNSDSKADMVQRYTSGYPEGTSKARAIILKLTPFLRTVQGIKRGWKPQRYAGGNFILDNYVRGIPELCNTMSPVVSKKFVSVVLNGWASAGVSIETMSIRGSAVIALVDTLEKFNYRVSVKLVYSPKGNGEAQLINIIDLKSFAQSLEIDRLAFFLADPCALRRLQFSMMETESKEVREYFGATGNGTGFYGMPGELPSSELKEQDLYISCASWYDSAWHSVVGAQAWIKETLRRYGVEFYG